jgi:hypothetical protein
MVVAGIVIAVRNDAHDLHPQRFRGLGDRCSILSRLSAASLGRRDHPCPLTGGVFCRDVVPRPFGSASVSPGGIVCDHDRTVQLDLAIDTVFPKVRATQINVRQIRRLSHSLVEEMQVQRLPRRHGQNPPPSV